MTQLRERCHIRIRKTSISNTKKPTSSHVGPRQNQTAIRATASVIKNSGMHNFLIDVPHLHEEPLEETQPTRCRLPRKLTGVRAAVGAITLFPSSSKQRDGNQPQERRGFRVDRNVFQSQADITYNSATKQWSQHVGCFPARTVAK